MQRLTSVQSNILVELAKYKFLTASQLHRLGVGKDIGWIRAQTKELETMGKPLIERITFGIVPRYGRLESVIFLTTHGKQALMDGLQMPESQIKMPVGNSSMFYKDYNHRRNTIDFQIELGRWANSMETMTVDFFDCYFDKIGNNRTGANLEAKNKIMLDEEDYIIPDGVFMLSTPERPYLFLFEMYDGKDTKRVFTQIKKHVKAIATGSPSEKYKHDKAHRIAVVFEFDAQKEAFLERTREDVYFTHVAKWFRCKSLEEVKNGFSSGWKNLNGEILDFI